MNSKAKKTVKIILILLTVLICVALAIYGAIYCMFTYWNNNYYEPTKSDLLISVMGDFTTEEHYRYGWWQDGATYSKYTYNSTDLNNEYLTPIAESDMGDIELKVSKFEFWVSSSKDDEGDKNLYENYDFDLSIVGTDDYWFIEYGEEDANDFEMFIFDIETKVLYRFTYSI